MRHAERSGKRALVRYRGTTATNEPIEDYSTGEPVEVYIGTGAVPPGIDQALYDMEVGERRTVRLALREAYGEHDPAGVRLYPRSFIRNGDKLREGTVFAWTNPASGRDIPVKVVEADEHYVTVDFNHPLAGKELIYWIELVSVG